MGYDREMGNNNSSGLQDENNARTEVEKNSKQENHLVLADNESKETGLASDKPRLEEDPDALDFQAKEGTEVYFPVGSQKIEVKLNKTDIEEGKTEKGTEIHFPVASTKNEVESIKADVEQSKTEVGTEVHFQVGSPKTEVKSNEADSEESKTKPFSMSETSEVGTEPEKMEGHAPVASQIIELGTNEIQPTSSTEDFKEHEKLPEPNMNEDQSVTSNLKVADEESVKDSNEQKPATEEMLELGLTDISRENGVVDFVSGSEFENKKDEFCATETASMLHEEEKFETENADGIGSDITEKRNGEFPTEMLLTTPELQAAVIAMVESGTEQEDTKPDNSPTQFTEEFAKDSKIGKTATDHTYEESYPMEVTDVNTKVAESGFLDNAPDKYQTESSVDPEGEFLTSEEPGLMPVESSVTNCQISGETMVVSEESGIIPLDLAILEKDKPTDKNIVDDTAQSKPNSVEQGQVFPPHCPVSLVQSGNCEIVSLADFSNEKTAKDQTEYEQTDQEYEQTDQTEIITRTYNLPILDTDQCAGRFNNESNPNNMNSHIQMRKSPSFGLDLRIKARSEEYDQTPPLYQDKAAIEDKSNQTDITFDNQVVHTRFDQGQLKYGGMPVEEKVIKLEKSDLEMSRTQLLGFTNEERNSSGKKEAASTSPDLTEKHKRRFSLFGICVCCATVTN